MSTSVSAEERLISAFWRLFPETPVARLGVTILCTTAGINRSTFYRSFDGMEDFLAVVEAPLPPRELPALISHLNDTDQLLAASDTYLRSSDTRFKKLALLLGPDGDPHFASYLRETMVHEWRQNLPHSLPPGLNIAFPFIAGGIFAILSEWAEAGFPGTFADYTLEGRRWVITWILRYLSDVAESVH